MTASALSQAQPKEGGAVLATALRPLPRAFYLRPTATVAQDLLGRYLVFDAPDGHRRVGRIVETEAYLGEHDRACHSWHGYTPRTAPMYEEGGRAYVYFVYGMYWCLNVVTEPSGSPCAVLLRAVEPVLGLDRAANGPGKLCRAFGIDGRWNRADLVESDLRVTAGAPVAAADVGVSARIGVAYAGDWAAAPLRFFDRTSAHLSRPASSALRRRPEAERARKSRLAG